MSFIAGLLWSSIGMVYLAVGKAQASVSYGIGGAIMIAVSCLFDSVLLMSGLCILTILVSWYFGKNESN